MDAPVSHIKESRMTDQWIDPEKINVIREYLQSEFQACQVTDLEDHDYMAQTFRIMCEGAAYLVTVRRKFFDDNRAPRIGEELLWVDYSKGIVTTTSLPVPRYCKSRKVLVMTIPRP